MSLWIRLCNHTYMRSNCNTAAPCVPAAAGSVNHVHRSKRPKQTLRHTHCRGHHVWNQELALLCLCAVPTFPAVLVKLVDCLSQDRSPCITPCAALQTAGAGSRECTWNTEMSLKHVRVRRGIWRRRRPRRSSTRHTLHVA